MRYNHLQWWWCYANGIRSSITSILDATHKKTLETRDEWSGEWGEVCIDAFLMNNKKKAFPMNYLMMMTLMIINIMIEYAMLFIRKLRWCLFSPLQSVSEVIQMSFSTFMSRVSRQDIRCRRTTKLSINGNGIITT